MDDKTNWEEICPQAVAPLTVEQKFPGGVRKPSREEIFRVNRGIALKMLETFGWSPWMAVYGVHSENGRGAAARVQRVKSESEEPKRIRRRRK